MTQLARAKITALGTFVPPRLLTNDDLEKMVETSNDWIVDRTGIRERHIVDTGVATSDLAMLTASHWPLSMALRMKEAVWKPPVHSTGMPTACLMACASGKFRPSITSPRFFSH